MPWHLQATLVAETMECAYPKWKTMTPGTEQKEMLELTVQRHLLQAPPWNIRMERNKVERGKR